MVSELFTFLCLVLAFARLSAIWVCYDKWMFNITSIEGKNCDYVFMGGKGPTCDLGFRFYSGNKLINKVFNHDDKSIANEKGQVYLGLDHDSYNSADPRLQVAVYVPSGKGIQISFYDDQGKYSAVDHLCRTKQMTTPETLLNTCSEESILNGDLTATFIVKINANETCLNVTTTVSPSTKATIRWRKMTKRVSTTTKNGRRWTTTTTLSPTPDVEPAVPNDPGDKGAKGVKSSDEMILNLSIAGAVVIVVSSLGVAIYFTVKYVKKQGKKGGGDVSKSMDDDSDGRKKNKKHIKKKEPRTATSVGTDKRSLDSDKKSRGDKKHKQTKHRRLPSARSSVKEKESHRMHSRSKK